MAPSFELMDLDSGNLVGSYNTLEEAMAIVRSGYTDYGDAGIRSLALLSIHQDGDQHLVSDDLDLFQLAFSGTNISRDV